ncbi:hypothetical protein [Streptomyces sp. SPB162]|uniref:hypothetical protein n=1 Tax=Streptomyces sp. SPB162 TaxID=2940560 RepID=UPI00240720FB|nr:hypothetical protein [Streptomyces sp. SPB162]
MPLTAEVSRRDFSHRENCLRRAVETRADIYQGQAKMLVRLEQLYEGDRNRWRGSTKSPMARTSKLLSSYLKTTGSDCFGVMAANGGSIEVRPGVLFPAADVRDADGVPPGSVVRLRRHGDGSVSAHVAIPADATFLSDWPRPVVAFPKDVLKTQQALKNADAHGNFTLAGLPGLNATAARGTGAPLLLTPHPKITGAVTVAGSRTDAVRLTTLRAAAGGLIVLPAAGDSVSGVRIRLLPTAGAQDEGRILDTEWARLSFMNGSAEEIATACRERNWRYHDELTRHWTEGADRPVRVRLPKQARAVEEPVFFSPHLTTWTLRHEPSALRRFGFPATELVENVRANEAAGRTVWAVAWADRRSVWLETVPGRVVEVCAELVRFADGSSLADLEWSFFSPGDMVYGRVQGGVNECGHLVLETWHPGVRGALGQKLAQRMLLPVAFADETNGALLLGDGADAFPYPADRRLLDQHSTDGAVWLNRSNELTSLKDSPVAAGDVVFLSAAADGGLRVLGLPQARVIVARPAERDWPGCDWLREELVAANRGGVLAAGLTGVPVTVLHVDLGSPATLTVSRRAQPGGSVSAGSVLVQPVADLGSGRIAVRSGSALFRVHMSALLPGLPKDAAEAAAVAFVGSGATVRLHWDEQARSLTGRPADGTDPDDTTAGSDERGETIVRPWLSVNDAGGNCRGVVCHDEQSHRLCWLAAEDAAWTADLTGSVLLEHLSGLRRVAVLRTGPGTVTFTGHSMNVREYDNLARGQRRRVTVVDPDLPTDPAGTAEPSRRCLVSVEPMGMLAVYTLSDGTASPATGKSLFAEVSRIGGPDGRRSLSLVEPGSNLTVLDLPVWMTGALQRLFHDGLSNGRPQPVDRLVDQRYRDYWAAYEQGLAGYGAVAKPEPESRAEANRVLRALGTYDAEQPVTANDRGEALAAVGSWLRSPEGQDTVLQRHAEVDLAPLLAVCRLGVRLGERRVGLPAGWLAYLLGRLGDRAVSSLHTEALVTQWITRRERHGSPLGGWQRLRTVEIAARLTPNQVAAVVDFGKAVTSRPALNLKESDAAPVARGLLAAVGALPAAGELIDDAPILRGLAELGAGLRPAHGDGVPRWDLLPQQQTVLRSAADKVMREDTIALTLLPAYAPLTGAMEEYAAQLLRAAARLRG